MEAEKYILEKNWKAKNSGNELTLSECPLCNKTAYHKFYINKDSGLWYCQVCNEKGNLWQLKKQLGDLPTFVGIDKFVGGQKTAKDYITPSKDKDNVYHQALLKNDDVLEYLIDQRCFTKETIEKHKLGYVDKSGKKFLSIPYYENGYLVNFKFRSLPPDKKTFQRAAGCKSILWNVDSLKDIPTLPKKERYAIITESETDGIALCQWGFEHVVSSSIGAGGFQEDWNNAFDHCEKIYIFFDNDPQGEKGAIKVASALGRYRCYRVNPKMHDVCQMQESGFTKEEVRECFLSAKPMDDNSIKDIGDFFSQITADRKRPNVRGHSTGFRCVDALWGGLRDGELTVVTGDTGCLVGDTIVNINRASIGRPFKLSHVVKMFNGGTASGRTWKKDIPTFIQSVKETGFWGLSKIIKAMDTGIQDVYKVVFSNGHNLVGTFDHKILCSNGCWTKMGDLIPGTTKVVCKDGPSDKKKCKKKHYKYICGLKHHPMATRKTAKNSPYRIAFHRLIVEADLNGLSYDCYIKKIRSGKTEHLVFLTRDQIVHHKDNDIKNNNLENLELTDIVKHSRQHSVKDNSWKNFGLTKTTYCDVVSIDHIGKQQTYDLTVEETHNYIANNIVTHNSGKSTYTSAVALNRAKEGCPVLICAFEQKPAEVVKKLVSMESGKAWHDLTDKEEEIAFKKLRHLPLLFLDRYGKTPIKVIKDAVYSSVKQRGVSFGIIDHLHFFLDIKNQGEERLAIDNSLIEIEKWVHDLDIHLKLVVHPTKVSIDQSGNTRDVDLNDLRGSASLKQIPDNVIRVKKNRNIERTGDPKATISVLKCRSSSGTEGTVELGFKPGAEVYYELDNSMDRYEPTEQQRSVTYGDHEYDPDKPF